MTADMPERYVIETTCPNCGHVAKSETSVEALSKARDWARNRSFEGVLPEIEATPSVCALERAGAARCTPELVAAETSDVMPNECPSCGGSCPDSWHRWVPGGAV